MTAKVLEETRLEAGQPETPMFGHIPPAGETVHTQYIRIVFQPLPMPYRGRPVVRKLPADWPYPPEDGYE